MTGIDNDGDNEMRHFESLELHIWWYIARVDRVNFEVDDT